jgi:hypothetical protein
VSSLCKLEPSSASVSHKRWRFRGTTCRAKEGQSKKRLCSDLPKRCSRLFMPRLVSGSGFSRIMPIRCIAHSPNCAQLHRLHERQIRLARSCPSMSWASSRLAAATQVRTSEAGRGTQSHHPIVKNNSRYAGIGISDIAVRPSACFERISPQKHKPGTCSSIT